MVGRRDRFAAWSEKMEIPGVKRSPGLALNILKIMLKIALNG